MWGYAETRGGGKEVGQHFVQVGPCRKYRDIRKRIRGIGKGGGGWPMAERGGEKLTDEKNWTRLDYTDYVTARK